MFPEKKQQMFVDWYISRYGETGENGTGTMPVMRKRDEAEEDALWKEVLTKILGKTNAKREYIHRGGRRDTWLGKVYSGLWLAYSPKFIDDDKFDEMFGEDVFIGFEGEGLENYYIKQTNSTKK